MNAKVKYILTYYIIGILVSLYNIRYYRFNENTKHPAHPMDSIGGLFGAWIWPLQLLNHIYRNR